MYAPAEYCAPVWCRSSHTHLVDVGFNASLRTITGCLRPNQVDQLPVLAEIAPPALMREAATLVLGRRACQHDHLLHDVMENSTHRRRLKSRRPLTHHAHQLVSSVPLQETVKHWTRTRWAESWASTITRLHKYMPTPSNSGQGVGLSRRAWTRLNWLRTGVGRFGETCCAGDCLLVTIVIVVPNKLQNTSLVDAVPSTARLRGSKDSLTWTLRRGHGSITVPWTCD